MYSDSGGQIRVTMQEFKYDNDNKWIRERERECVRVRKSERDRPKNRREVIKDKAEEKKGKEKKTDMYGSARA